MKDYDLDRMLAYLTDLGFKKHCTKNEVFR